MAGNPERPLHPIDVSGIGRPVFLPDGRHLSYTHGLRPIGQIVDGIYSRAYNRRVLFGTRQSLQEQLADALDFLTYYWRQGERIRKRDIQELAERYQCDPMEIRRILWPEEYGHLLPDDIPPLIILDLAEEAERVPDEGDQLPQELVEWLKNKAAEIENKASF